MSDKTVSMHNLYKYRIDSQRERYVKYVIERKTTSSRNQARYVTTASPVNPSQDANVVRVQHTQREVHGTCSTNTACVVRRKKPVFLEVKMNYDLIEGNPMSGIRLDVDAQTSQDATMRRVDLLPRSEIGSCVQTLKGNEIYRIGDVVVGGVSKIISELSRCKEYDETLLGRYVKRGVTRKPLKRRVDELANLMNTHVFHGNVMPPDDALVIHVRAGDDYLNRGLGSKSIMKETQNAINHMMKRFQLKSIIVVTAFHYGVADASKLYPSGKRHRYSYKDANKDANISVLYEFIRSQKYPVYIKSSKDVDVDFAFLCYAKHLVTTGGGFSKLVRNINDIVIRHIKS